MDAKQEKVARRVEEEQICKVPCNTSIEVPIEFQSEKNKFGSLCVTIECRTKEQTEKTNSLRLKITSAALPNGEVD